MKEMMKIFTSPSRSFSALCFWRQNNTQHFDTKRHYINKQCEAVGGAYGWVCVCTFSDWLEFVYKCLCVCVFLLYSKPIVAVRACPMINENCRTAEAAAYTAHRLSVPELLAVFSNGFHIVTHRSSVTIADNGIDIKLQLDSVYNRMPYRIVSRLVCRSCFFSGRDNKFNNTLDILKERNKK